MSAPILSSCFVVGSHLQNRHESSMILMRSNTWKAEDRQTIDMGGHLTLGRSGLAVYSSRSSAPPAISSSTILSNADTESSNMSSMDESLPSKLQIP